MQVMLFQVVARSIAPVHEIKACISDTSEASRGYQAASILDRSAY